MSAVSSSYKRTANKPRRFDKRSQLMTGYCKHQARRLVSKIIKLCSASRTTFRAWFYRTDPQKIEGQFGTLSGFLRNTFRKRTSQKKPRMYFRPKSFRTIFEKRTPVYSFAAPLLGLAKSIYYRLVIIPLQKKTRLTPQGSP